VQRVIQRTQDRQEAQCRSATRNNPGQNIPVIGQQLVSHLLPQKEMVFTSVPEAEQRTAQPGPEWPALTDTARRQIQELSEGGQREQALQMAWEMISPSLTLRNRVAVELTTDVGYVEGQRISIGRTGLGMCIPYVRRKSNCVGLDQTAHLRSHTPDEINFILQIGNRVFHRPPEEQVASLLTTIMHEYSHAEEQVARGFLAQETFNPAIGNREFLYSENVPESELSAVMGLDEINACCDEIENAARTGLANSYEMRNVLNYLWDNYSTYYGAVRGSPNAGVVMRVRRNIGNGRRLLAGFLRTPPGQRMLQTVRVSLRDFILQQAPRDLDESMLRPPATAPTVTP
jgi:hypothetical protein